MYNFLYDNAIIYSLFLSPLKKKEPKSTEEYKRWAFVSHQKTSNKNYIIKQHSYVLTQEILQ